MLPEELLNVPTHPRPRLRWAVEVRNALSAAGATGPQIAVVIAAGLDVSMMTAFRLSLGLTQDALADLYNDRWTCDPPKTGKYIAAWEAWRLTPGRRGPASARTPSTADLIRLAVLFGCTLDDLLTPTGTTSKAEALVALAEPRLSAAPQPLASDGEKESVTNRRRALQAAMLAALTPLAENRSAHARASGRGPTAPVSPPVLDSIVETVRRAQRLDDAGSGARAYVADQANTVDRTLHRDKYTAATGRELQRCLAQLAQTAGFMHYDAGLNPAARNWYNIALAAANEAGDAPLRASILSLMSNQAATDGRAHEALALCSAAQHAARHAHPLVRALVTARSGLAHAAAGDLTQLRRVQDLTHRHLDDTTRTADDVPPWAYYVNDTELHAILGRSMVTLVRKTGRGQIILPEAEELLRGRALADEAAYGRSGLLHASWLALTHAQAGEPERAVEIGRHALRTGRAVVSHRSTDLLHQLREDMTQYVGVPKTAELLTDLKAYLSHT